VGAGVKTPYEVTPLLGLQRRAGDGIKVLYAPGYKNYAGRIRPGSEPGPLQALSIDEEADPGLLAEAVELARSADLVLFFCGTNKTIETEGSDRQDIKLPVGQETLAAALAQANPNMVSVVISGGPCELGAVDACSKALVQGWWNGIEGGTALAEVLFGDRAPSGKLPFTFPRVLEDSPAYAMGNFPNRAETQEDLFTGMYRADMGGTGRQFRRQAPDSRYTEGLLVGYRWFDTKGVPAAYAFGHGLSYVDFEYSGLKASKAAYKEGQTIKVSFSLRNAGAMPAEEVAQLYVSRKDAKVEYPVKELKAFKRVVLNAGETRKVTLEVPVSELRWWSADGWKLEKGTVELLLGSASDDLRQKVEVEIQ
jgi:beta-glucosidase